MENQIVARKTNRREMLKLSSMGVLGGLAANALTSGKAQAAEGTVNVSYASWIHGHSMQVEYPDRLARHERLGWGTVVEGNPGTSNWFHFAIPTPVVLNDVRLQADSIMVCFNVESVDAIIENVHVYDGPNRIATFENINLQPEEPFVRLTLPDTPTMGLALGLSLGVAFGVEPVNHTMMFSAIGCDFVFRPVSEE